MNRLEDLRPNTTVRGILPDCLITVVNVQWYGSTALELTYKTPTGKVVRDLPTRATPTPWLTTRSISAAGTNTRAPTCTARISPAFINRRIVKTDTPRRSAASWRLFRATNSAIFLLRRSVLLQRAFTFIVEMPTDV
jgi:hypothetical protein